MGHPSSSKPSLASGISEGRGLWLKASSLGTNNKDLPLFKLSPLEGPSFLMMARALIKSSDDPQSFLLLLLLLLLLSF